MKKLFLTLCCILIVNAVFAGEGDVSDFIAKKVKRTRLAVDTPATPVDNSPPADGLSGFGNYNFGGGNTGFSTPQGGVDYGFNYPINGKKGSIGYFQFLPAIYTPVNATLSKNYLPALMLPGAASVSINTFFNLTNNIVWSPVNVGLKFLGGFSDSSKTIIQHNVRTALSFQIDKLISIAGQYTWAWHNSTDDSERSFEYVFKKNDSEIQYWTITLQGRVSAEGAKTPSYLIIQWRNLVNPGQFTGLQNNRIFTIGFKAEMNLSTNTQAIY